MASPGSLRRAVLGTALVALSVGGAGSALAQASGQTGSASSPIDPDAMAAVDKMSAALRDLSSFHATSDVTTEIVLETGQKIQFGGTLDIWVRRPNAFKIVANADTRSREMYYDGKSFTIFAPRIGYYASFDAPSTIAMTIDKAYTQYGIEIPLADLFTWGTDQTVRSRVQEATVIRPEHIGSRLCMHYAFRQEKADWQLWIDQGDRPLPCKLVITSRVDPAMPQYSAILNWDTTPVAPGENLAFVPPADAHRITMADVAKQTQQGVGQ